MIFCKAALSNLDDIMEIVSQAQASMRANNIDQWQNGYPDRKTILEDIAGNSSYVLKDGENIAASAAILFQNESAYDKIYDGEWLTGKNGIYACIHRIAVADAYKKSGTATQIVTHAANMAKKRGFQSIRIDTHADNFPMQGMLKKNEFVRCGTIFLADGGKRIAFEKLL